MAWMLLSASGSEASVTLLDHDQWKVTMNGFVEADASSDSTKGFVEIIGNSPVPRGDVASGMKGRTQFSVRNSRLAFGLNPPEQQSFKIEADLEMDFLGFDPSPAVSSSTANLTTEANYFNNPTLRIRHAYMAGRSGNFQILAGQTWSLLGWQPYYFSSTADVAPLPGMLYSRTAELKVLQSVPLTQEHRMQFAIAVLRPPQRDSSVPEIQAGFRMTMGSLYSGYSGSAVAKKISSPASLAVSGSWREFEIPDTKQNSFQSERFRGGALALNFLIPIVPSFDLTEVGNTVSLIGEWSMGTGYGDQFIGWTGGTATPLGSAASGAASVLSANNRPLNLDGGIGDFNPNGVFKLIELQSFALHAQYHLPTRYRSWITLGFNQLFSPNIQDFADSLGKSTSSNLFLYKRTQAIFFNLFTDFTNQIRFALEFVHVRTSYVDGVNAHNNRYQFSTYFMF